MHQTVRSTAATRWHRRLLLGGALGTVALLLAFWHGTGALYEQAQAVPAASVTTARESLTIGSAGIVTGRSDADVTLSASTPTAYSAGDLSLLNAGTDTRQALAFTVSDVSVAGATTTAAEISVTWALANAGSACRGADYAGARVWSASTLSGKDDGPAVGSPAAQSVTHGQAQQLCARYTLIGSSITAGALDVTYTFLGWTAPAGTFTSNTVTWAQHITVTAPTPALMPRPIVTDCGKAFSYNGTVLHSYQFGWYYPWRADGWAPSGYRVTWSGTPTQLPSKQNPAGFFPVTFDSGGTGQHLISVQSLDDLHYDDMVGTATIVGLDADGNVATEPAVMTYAAKGDQSHPFCTHTS